MKHVMCCGLAALALSVPAGAEAQKMDNMKEMTYTGCLERTPEGAITLAGAMASHDAAKKPVSRDAMAKDSMSKDSMSHDSMVKDSMVPPLTLSSKSVDLAKHVGHKVTIKGVNSNATGTTPVFTVKSLKMVASSCM